MPVPGTTVADVVLLRDGDLGMSAAAVLPVDMVVVAVVQRTDRRARP